MTYLITLASIIVMAGGFVVLHYALARPTAELRVAGWTLVVGGLLNIAAVFYFPPINDGVRPASAPVYSGWHNGCEWGKKGMMNHDKDKAEKPAKSATKSTEGKSEL